MTNDKSLRAATIRLAHAKPELREHLLPLLKEAAKDPLDIRDPQTGKTYEELKAEMDATLATMYKENEGQTWTRQKSDAINRYQKEMGARVERLRQRVEKAKRGLRLSTNPKHMALKPAHTAWFEGGDTKVSAIVSTAGDVLGWMVQKDHRIPVSAPGSRITHGYEIRARYTPYSLDAKKIPGMGDSGTANRALDDFSDWMKKQLPKT